MFCLQAKARHSFRAQCTAHTDKTVICTETTYRVGVRPVSVSGQCLCPASISVGVGPVSLSGQSRCRASVSVGVGSVSVSGRCRCRASVGVGPVYVSGQCLCRASIGVGPVSVSVSGQCRVGVVSVLSMWISSLSLSLSLLQFSSVQDGICALGNAQMRCTPFLCCSWRNKTKGSATPLMKPGMKEHHRQRSKECTSHLKRTNFLRL